MEHDKESFAKLAPLSDNNTTNATLLQHVLFDGIKFSERSPRRTYLRTRDAILLPLSIPTRIMRYKQNETARSLPRNESITRMKFSIAFLIRITCSKINRGSYKDARSQFTSLLFSFFLSLFIFFISFFLFQKNSLVRENAVFARKNFIRDLFANKNVNPPCVTGTHSGYISVLKNYETRAKNVATRYFVAVEKTR